MCISLSEVIPVTVQYWFPFIDIFNRLDNTISKDRMSELQIRKDITKCDGIMLVTILTPVWRH
jgi:hypothetical protein